MIKGDDDEDVGDGEGDNDDGRVMVIMMVTDLCDCSLLCQDLE